MSNEARQQRIKVYYCITSLGIGGAERLLFLYLKYCDRSKVDVKVITVVGEGVFAEKIRSLGIEVVNMNKTTTLGLGVLLRLWWIFWKEKPDLVHTHLFGGDTWGRIPAILARVPVILTTEHLMNHDERGIKRWLKQGLSPWTDAVIAVSDAVLQFSASVDHIPKAKLKRVYGPVDVAAFSTISEKKPEHHLTIVGRMIERKGHETLFRACALLQSAFPDLVIRVVFADGDPHWEARMRRLVFRSGLEKNVRWMKDQIDLQSIFEQTDVMVMPSYFEGLGLAALEAMAAGRMVIASNVGGLNEIIESGRTGLLVPMKDEQQLADAIRYCFEHPGICQSMAAAGRERIVNNFGIQSFVATYDQIYHDLLRTKGVLR